MDTTCDNCGHIFEVILLSKDIGKGLQQEYIRCPECDTEYPTLKTNALIRKLRDSPKNTVNSKTRKQLQIETKKIN